MERWRTTLIRENLEQQFLDTPFTSPDIVAEAFRKLPISSDKENLVVFNLNAKNFVVGYSIVSTGTVSSSLTHPREVFKSAIISSCSSILLAHNHPSGDPTPSKDDLGITIRLIKAGSIIGIDLLDHIIITHKDSYSLKRHNKNFWVV